MPSTQWWTPGRQEEGHVCPSRNSLFSRADGQVREQVPCGAWLQLASVVMVKMHRVYGAENISLTV